jgi:hypothetical protein
LWHIRHREALATDLAVRHLASYIPPGVRLILRTDSTPAAWAWRRGKTNKRINDAASRGLLKLYRRGVFPTVEHIPGVRNRRADYLSRNPDPKNYQLRPSVFRTMCEKFRINPQLDLFASKENHQLPKYCIWRADRKSLGDAFALDWTGRILWANPPWELITRFLQKAPREKITALVCLPVWKSAPWWGQVVSMQATRPFILRGVPIFQNPRGDALPMPRCGTMFTVLQS